MARAGVTYIQVANAAQSLKQLDLEPTVDRVREKLGTGSKSTIAPFLKQWKTKNTDLEQVAGLPGELLQVVKSLYERVEGDASLKIAEASTEFDSIVNDLRQDLANAKSTIKELSAKNGELVQNNKSLSEKLEIANIDNAASQLKEKESESEISKLTGLLSEQKEATKHAQTHLEYFQEKTAEDKQQDRNRYDTAIQQHQRHVEQLIEQSQLLSKQVTNLQSQLKENGSIMIELEKENAILKQRSQRSSEELDTMSLELKKLVEINDKLKHDYSLITAEQHAASKEVKYLAESLKKTEAELIGSREKQTTLNDEIKLIVKEKAVIEGRFSQLQNSL